MEEKKITVIIPTYNREEVTKRAVESVLMQGYENLEIIIVDDFSNDGSYEKLLVLYDKNDVVKIIRRQGEIKGGNAARYTGIKKATGDYVAFLDSDDQFVEGSLHCRVKWFEEHSDVDMVYGDSEVNGKLCRYDTIQDYNQHRYLMEELSLCEYGVIMFKRDFLSNMREIDISLKAWQDDDFVLNIDESGGVINHCGEKVLVHNFSEISITNNFWNRFYGCRAIVKKYKKAIINECGFFRYILWKLRIIYDWCEAKGKSELNPIERKIIGWIQYVSYLVCIKKFRHMYG